MKTLYQSIQVAMLCIITLLLSIPLKAQTSLSGNIVDEETGESIPFGNIALFNNGVYITSVKTDSKGNYCFTNVDAGTYDVEIRQIGYLMRRIKEYIILRDRSNTLNIEIEKDVDYGLGGVILLNITVPLAEMNKLNSDSTAINGQIQYLPTKPIKQVELRQGIDSHNENDNLIVRSAQVRSNNYYTKGIRIYGDCKFITQSPTFVLVNFNQSFSVHSLFLNFEIIGKGNITFSLINNQNQTIYNRTTFMNEGKQEIKIDFINANIQLDMNPLILQYDNGLQEIKTTILL